MIKTSQLYTEITFIIVLLIFTTITPKVSAQSYNMSVDGKAVHVQSYKNFYYATVFSTSSVSVQLSTTGTFTSVDVSPRRLGISSSVTEETANFQLPSKGYYVVYINNTTRLFIFVEEPETTITNSVNVVTDLGIENQGNTDMTSKIQEAVNNISNTGKTLFFPAGLYLVNSLSVPSNTKIYLQYGAVLKVQDNVNSKIDGIGPCQLLIRNASNVEIKGRGAFDGNGTVHVASMGQSGRGRVLIIVNSNNVNLEGITLRDAGSWNTHVVHSQNITFQNVKILSDVNLPNTDGIDPDCSKHVLIENCFLYNGDDNIAIKSSTVVNVGIPVQNCDDITVRGNVLLTQKSSLKVGTETLADSMKNITFENNDVIEADRGMALYSYDGAVFDSISYINNSFENVYHDSKQCWLMFEIAKRSSTSKIGSMKNIVVKDSKFYSNWSKGSRILGYDDNHRIQVCFDNNSMNGVVLDDADKMNISYLDGFEDITWDSATGISEYDDLGISVFPNPSNGRFIITGLLKVNNLGIQIIDMQGRTILSKGRLGNTTGEVLDISKFPQGVYFVRISIGNNLVIKKILKNN